MKKQICVTFIVLALAGMLAGTAGAENNNHYVNGVEGIKAASIPPPGFYYKMYNVLYTSDTMNDDEGDETDIDFDLTVFANVHRLIWISDMKLLGGDFGVDVIIPLVHTDIEIGALGVEDSEFGLGDIFIEPFVLSWHGAQFDSAIAAGVYCPTGSDGEPASPGKDMWTFMFTAGLTAYFDTSKTWSASILGRYEIHDEKGDTDITPGDDFHFEWGVAKTASRFWDVGIVGYSQWQVTEDSGTGSDDVKDMVHAIGPEVSTFLPGAKMAISFRTLMEFGAEDRSEGTVATLVFTKMF